ncbi:MAG TPA: hypothetical protein VFE01_01875 [Terracidiphilus sp.]|jgi:hypothetical protein|nr:hypothetical protein [Terracidiphilus sp.]
MIVPVLQIAAISFVAVYLGRARVAAWRRTNQTWDSLIARLRHDWSARDLSDHFLSKEGLNTTPNETWDRIQGPKGLWAMYHNAGVMLEIADFASRNSGTIDAAILANLRNDAIQIRASVLKSLAEYSLNMASENVRFNAFRVASMYTGMAARMAELLQDNAAFALPDFVAAM